MQLSGYEKELLECGTFSLPQNYSNHEPHPTGIRLVELKLAVRDDVKLAGEDRYIITELGEKVLHPERMISSEEFEEQALLGKEPPPETLGDALKTIQSGDEGAIDGTDSASSEG